MVWNMIFIRFNCSPLAFVQVQANITGSSTQGTVTGLTPQTKYTCTIYAVSGSDGPVSDPITVITNYGGIQKNSLLIFYTSVVCSS